MRRISSHSALRCVQRALFESLNWLEYLHLGRATSVLYSLAQTPSTHLAFLLSGLPSSPQSFLQGYRWSAEPLLPTGNSNHPAPDFLIIHQQLINWIAHESTETPTDTVERASGTKPTSIDAILRTLVTA
jgi:hypothetical protein